MSKDLSARNEVIAEKKVVVTGLIEEVTAKAEVADRDAKAAAIKKEQLAKDAVIIEKEEADAAESLKAAKPALEAAKEALKDVNSSDIAVVKGLANPSDIIKEVCAIAYLLYPKTNLSDTSWPSVKVGLLGDMGLVKNLQEYQVAECRPNAATKAQSLVDKQLHKNKVDADGLKDMVQRSSGAVAGLFSWANATLKAYVIFRDVEPKRKKAEQMRKQKIQGEKDLAEIIQKVKELNENVAQL